MRCLRSSIEPQLQHLLLVKAKARQFAIDDFHTLMQTPAELDSRLEENARTPDCDYESDDEYAPGTDGRRLARAIRQLPRAPQFPILNIHFSREEVSSMMKHAKMGLRIRQRMKLHQDQFRKDEERLSKSGLKGVHAAAYQDIIDEARLITDSVEGVIKARTATTRDGLAPFF